MKSQVSLMILATMFLVLISYHHLCEAAFVTAADIQGAPYRVKRSFCNTYGGCSSSKRSIQQQAAATTSYRAGASDIGLGSTENGESTIPIGELAKKDTRAGLVAEILGDLIEYLQTDEKYRQGKYVVMVPKQYDTSRNPLSTTQQETNSPGEMQELQVSYYNFGEHTSMEATGVTGAFNLTYN